MSLKKLKYGCNNILILPVFDEIMIIYVVLLSHSVFEGIVALRYRTYNPWFEVSIPRSDFDCI